MSAVVVVPYVDGMLSANLVRVVKLSGYPHRFCQLDRLDEGAYGRLVRGLWRSPTDTVIIEHDVEPTLGQLVEVCECGHDWCGLNYDDGLYPDGPMHGCVRHSRRLKDRRPHTAEDALVIGKRRDTECEWWRVDAMMARSLMIQGETWQAHDGRVHHVHQGAPSGPP